MRRRENQIEELTEKSFSLFYICLVSPLRFSFCYTIATLLILSNYGSFCQHTCGDASFGRGAAVEALFLLRVIHVDSLILYVHSLLLAGVPFKIRLLCYPNILSFYPPVIQKSPPQYRVILCLLIPLLTPCVPCTIPPLIHRSNRGIP